MFDKTMFLELNIDEQFLLDGGVNGWYIVSGVAQWVAVGAGIVAFAPVGITAATGVTLACGVVAGFHQISEGLRG